MKTAVKITLNPAYEGLRSFVEGLPQRFEREGRVIYDARNQIRAIEHNDLIINAKRYCVPRPFNRLVYSFLRQPKAVRAYQNALRLQQMGIATPTPIAYILCGRRLLGESFLVTVQSALPRNFYEFRHHPLQSYEPIVRQFARFTADIHQKGVLHLDYSPAISFSVLMPTESAVSVGGHQPHALSETADWAKSRLQKFLSFVG